MKATVRTTVKADGHIRLANKWWRTNRRAAPDLFHKELTTAFETLRSSPVIGLEFAPENKPRVRRVLLPESRYHVYYRYYPRRDEVVVAAVWGAVRGRVPRL